MKNTLIYCAAMVMLAITAPKKALAQRTENTDKPGKTSGVAHCPTQGGKPPIAGTYRRTGADWLGGKRGKPVPTVADSARWRLIIEALARRIETLESNRPENPDSSKNISQKAVVNTKK